MPTTSRSQSDELERAAFEEDRVPGTPAPHLPDGLFQTLLRKPTFVESLHSAVVPDAVRDARNPRLPAHVHLKRPGHGAEGVEGELERELTRAVLVLEAAEDASGAGVGGGRGGDCEGGADRELGGWRGRRGDGGVEF